MTIATAPFIGEIRIFPFSFAPGGWALCNGQLLPISQHTALFSLLGTFYGGDGRSTFALPDLQGSAPMHVGTGPGLSDRFLGDMSGTDTVTLLESETPVHTHTWLGSPGLALDTTPAGEALARATGGNLYHSAPTSPVAMAIEAVSFAGGGLPHNNMQPFLTLSFCIALEGVFPSRT